MIGQDMSRAKRAERIDSHAAAVILQGAIDGWRARLSDPATWAQAALRRLAALPPLPADCPNAPPYATIRHAPPVSSSIARASKLASRIRSLGWLPPNMLSQIQRLVPAQPHGTRRNVSVEVGLSTPRNRAAGRIEADIGHATPAPDRSA